MKKQFVKPEVEIVDIDIQMVTAGSPVPPGGKA